MFKSENEKIMAITDKNLLKSKRVENTEDEKINKSIKYFKFKKCIYFFPLILLSYILYMMTIFQKSKGKENFNINNVHKNNSDNYIFSLNLSYNDLQEIFHNNNDVDLFLKNKTLFYLEKRKSFLKRKNRNYNESNIITFQNKLDYLLIHESPEYKSILADKIRLGEYSQKILGKNICVPILKIYNDSSEINLDDLPEKFVLKCNHGSSFNILVKDKSEFNLQKAKKLLNKWMNSNYGFVFFEPQYFFIKRKILLSPYLGRDLKEYKIFCFNGEPKYIVVSKGLNNGMHLYNYYDLNWNLTEIEHNLLEYVRDPTVNIEKPKNLNLMIEYAKKLSAEFVFVRVDLYDINGTIYLSEMTFSPSDNNMKYKNEEQRIYLGSLLDITKIRPYLFNQ